MLVKAGTLFINTGQISSKTLASGKGGSVAVAVDGTLAIDGLGTNPQITALSTGGGDAGSGRSAASGQPGSTPPATDAFADFDEIFAFHLSTAEISNPSR